MSSSSEAKEQQEHLKKENWVSTIHYGNEDSIYDTLEEVQAPLNKIKAKCRYWIVGQEICPTTGKKHLQCFFQFKERIRRTTLVRILPAFFDPMSKFSSPQAAADYCKKEGNFKEEGELKPIVGAAAQAEGRNRGGDKNAERWKRARAILEGNGDIADLDDQIYVVHYSSCMAIRRRHMPPPQIMNWTETPNLWIYGKSGCGKSRKAFTENPGAYSKMCNKWWDGYTGQKVAIIDDFDKRHDVLIHHLKIWADRYGYIAEIKGGAEQIRPEKIIITSNYAPEDIWSDVTGDLEPIRRKFRVINMSPMDGAFMEGGTGSGSSTAATFNGPTPPNTQAPGEGPTGTQPLSDEEDPEEGHDADIVEIHDLTGV